MLEEGAGSRSALEIADAIDFLGADLGAGSTFDSSAVRLHVPVARLADALPIMADVALRPTFPSRRARAAAPAAAHRAAPGARRSRRRSPRWRSRASCTGRRTATAPATAAPAKRSRRITVADLRALYAARFRPANSALLVVGDVVADRVDAAARNELRRAGRAPAPAAGAALPHRWPSRQARDLDRRQTGRGAVADPHRLDRRGRGRRPTTFPIQVMNTILGGSFTSRLNMNLREKHGYTYGADVRPSTCARRRAVRRRRGRPDRQDRGGAEGVLQRAERDSTAGARRRAGAREELRLAAIPLRLRNDDRYLPSARGRARLPPARRLLLELRVEHRGGHGRRRAARGARNTSSPIVWRWSSSATAR